MSAKTSSKHRKQAGKAPVLNGKTTAAAAPTTHLTTTTKKGAKKHHSAAKPLKVVRANVLAPHVSFFYRTYKNILNAYSGDPRKSALATPEFAAAERVKFDPIFARLGVDPGVFSVKRGGGGGPSLRFAKAHMYHLCNQMVAFLRGTLRNIGSGTSSMKTVKASHLLDAVLLRLRSAYGLGSIADDLEGLARSALIRSDTTTSKGDPTTTYAFYIPKPSRKDTRGELRVLLGRKNVGLGAVEVVACTFVWSIILAQQALATTIRAIEGTGGSTGHLISSKKGKTIAYNKMGTVLKGSGLERIVQSCKGWMLNATKLATGSYGNPFVTSAIIQAARELGGGGGSDGDAEEEEGGSYADGEGDDGGGGATGKKGGGGATGKKAGKTKSRRTAHVRLYNGFSTAFQMAGNAFLVALREHFEHSIGVRNKQRLTAEDIRNGTMHLVNPSILRSYMAGSITPALYVPRKVPGHKPFVLKE